MKKITPLKVVFLMVLTAVITATTLFFLATPEQADAYSSLVNRLRGKILIRVQHSGEAWYVNPDNGQRYFLGNGTDAYNLMRSLGLGITDSDLTQIPKADGYYDKYKFTSNNFGFYYDYPSTLYQLENKAPYSDVSKFQFYSNYNTASFPSMNSNGIWIKVAVYDNQDNLTIQQYADKYPTALPTGAIKTMSSIFSISSYPAIKVTVDNLNGQTGEKAYTVTNYVLKGNKAYVIEAKTKNLSSYQTWQYLFNVISNSFNFN